MGRDGSEQYVDAIISCTGFRPALPHLSEMRGRAERGHMPSSGPAGTQVTSGSRLFLVRYGDRTGPGIGDVAGCRPQRPSHCDRYHRLPDE